MHTRAPTPQTGDGSCESATCALLHTTAEEVKDQLVTSSGPIGSSQLTRSRPSMGKKSGKAEGARCRRHPRQRQGAGVCASCLRERLSHLSLPASLPSVVRGGGCEREEEEDYDYEDGASSCSEVSTAYSSEGSSCGSSGCASPAEPAFHDEVRRAARVSLLMRHERVVGDADAVAVLLARREQRRRRAATGLWAKLLHATRGGGRKQQQQEGCSLAHSKTLQERAAAAKWVLF